MEDSYKDLVSKNHIGGTLQNHSKMQKDIEPETIVQTKQSNRESGKILPVFCRQV